MGLENSWLELAVAIGWPGLSMVVAAITLIAVTSAGRNAECAAALAFYVIAAAGFNLLEANMPAHIVLGMLLAIAMPLRPVLPDASRVHLIRRPIGSDLVQVT